MSSKSEQDIFNPFIELIHFGFRSIISEPDRILRNRGLNRSHHRILYFVNRMETVRMTDLISILDISRQALHRPLKQLQDQKLVKAVQVPEDRRNYDLILTDEGKQLEESLTGPQRAMFAAAKQELGAEALANWSAVMSSLSRGTAWEEFVKLTD